MGSHQNLGLKNPYYAIEALEKMKKNHIAIKIATQIIKKGLNNNSFNNIINIFDFEKM